jgi:D-alanyl-D-alanine carboxypeptidase/D-alanyl-D-alanine-endopeptidase (penicillin-binding protein 4)
VVPRRSRLGFWPSLILAVSSSVTPAIARQGAATRQPIAGRVAGRMLAPKGRTPQVTPARRDVATEARQVKDPNDPHEQRVTKLRERLLAVLHEAPLNRTRVGVQVMQASDGDVLFAHNAQAAFNPASNTKMLTTAAAISLLGSDWRYHTALYGPAPDASGVVHGDVALRGSGDPSLTNTDVAEIARDLQRHGITRIEGDLYADPRFHDAKGVVTPDPGVGEGAIILNRNTYAVHVRPGEVGHSAVVWVEPRAEVFGVENQATTVKGKRSRLRIDSYRKDDRLIVTVRGRIAESRGEYVDLRRLADGALLAGAVLRSALADFGVEMTGRVRSGGVVASNMLGEHQSAPLADVCKISNKPSNNFVAEAIYKTLGGELYGLPGTLAKGTKAVMEYLTAAGVKPGSYKIVNGSGLTHENRITASDLARLLRTIYYDPAVAPDFLTSLAIAGIDGTIRNRFMGTEAVGLVRAKTGTLSGVSALSGYVGDKDDVLVFSIFVQGFRNKRTNEVRHAQVRMVQAMLSYLRADAPGLNGEKKGPEIPSEEPTDYESDGDPTASPSTPTEVQ